MQFVIEIYDDDDDDVKTYCSDNTDSKMVVINGIILAQEEALHYGDFTNLASIQINN